LSEWNVDRRAALLLESLQKMQNPSGGIISGAHNSFPPEFSPN
jgi:hypothetical protein